MQFQRDDNTKGKSFSKDDIEVHVQDHYNLNTVNTFLRSGAFYLETIRKGREKAQRKAD
jgi:hypothetical protein